MNEKDITVAELNDLLNQLHIQSGYDFTGYSTSSVIRRMLRFMAVNQIPSIQALGSKIQNNLGLAEELIRDLSVTVTELFRDPSFYRSLREKVVQRLASYPVIKIWVAGCATGEEAYSLAILMKEEGLLNRCVIYATDINPHSIDVARAGIYPLSSMKLYTANYLESGGSSAFSEYYIAKYNSVLLDKSLREKIIFSTHNLVSDAGFNEFQLITCRNVLIYFAPALQSKVVQLFYDSLCSFGFLCLGNRESLLFSGKKNHFDEINRKERIFMKSEKAH